MSGMTRSEQKEGNAKVGDLVPALGLLEDSRLKALKEFLETTAEVCLDLDI